jgi:peptide/nickel transport system substrate-binding protein
VAAIWINVKANAQLSNVKVRQALAWAINREDIAQKATAGISQPVQYMIDPLVVPPSPNLFIYKYDPAMAERLLDEAGFPRGPDGKRFTLELMTRTGEPDEQTFALLIKDQLAKVGIDVSIKTVDFATYLTLQTKFQYQMATIKYWIPPLWAYVLFHTEWIGKGIFTNNFQYSNPQVDDLLNRWLVETDPKKQVELMQKVEDHLSRDLPVIVLYKVIWPNFIRDTFAGPGIPVGKYVFYDPLAHIYYTPIQPREAPLATENALLIGGIIAVVVAVAVAATLYRRKAKAPSQPKPSP